MLFLLLHFVFKVDQDFTMLFVGEEVSAKFLAKWPTKPRIIKDCKNLSQSTELDELLISAQRYSDEGGKCKLEMVDFACLYSICLIPTTQYITGPYR